MGNSYWYEQAAKVIRRIVAENPGATTSELRRLAGNAYPFGPKKHWPFKKWCDAMNDILGPSPQKVAGLKRKIEVAEARSGQTRLFEEADRG